MIGVGPIQKSLAGAGVASPQDSSWILLNPASLTQLERQADVSVCVFAPNRSLDSSANPPAGRTSDDSMFFVPTVSAKLGVWNGLHLGLGLFGSSGMGTDYDDPRILGPGGDSRAEYAVAKLALAGAVDLGDGWSIGAGPVLVLSRMRTDMLDGTMTPSSDEWDYAFGVGYTVGIMKQWDRLSLGASYLSDQYQEKWDEYRSLMPQRLNLPEQVQVGLAYALTESVEVMLDYRFIHWSGVAQWGDEPPSGFGWHDQHCFKVGVQWEVNQDFTLRAGFSHADSPIRSNAVFANGLFPAVPESHASLGFTYRLTEELDLSMTYTHAFHKSVTDDGSLLGPTAKGTTIGMYQNSLTTGLAYRF